MDTIQSPRLSKIAYSVLLFFLSLFIFTLPKYQWHMAGDTIPNQFMPISILGEHDLDFDEFVPSGEHFADWFWDEKDRNKHSLDLNDYFASRNHIESEDWYRNVKGRIISVYPIIPGILNLPVFFVAHLLGYSFDDLLTPTINRLLSQFSASLICAFSVLFMYLCLLKICTKVRTALFFALLYAFATCVLSVASRAIWQHGPSLLFFTIALLLIMSKREGLVSLSGFFLGMAVFNRPTNIAIVLPLTLYIFLHHRKCIVRYIVFASLPAMLLLLYSYVYWGDIFSLGQGWRMNSLRGNFFAGLTGLLFSPSRGLFIFSPFLIFSFMYLFYALCSRGGEPLYRYVAVAVILLLLLYSKWPRWWGEYQFGYRLLIELLPFLMIFLAVFWEKGMLRKPYLKATFFIFLAWSLYVHFLGAFYYPCGFNDCPDEINSHPERLWDFKDGEITRCTQKMLGHKFPCP